MDALEWVPKSPNELTDALETAGDTAPAEILAKAIRHATVGREEFSALVAGLLFAFHQTRSWQRLRFPSFRAYVEAELPFSLRTAQQMIRVYRVLRELGIPHERLRTLGWSKVALVARVLHSRNAERVLHDVETRSFAQLKGLYGTTVRPRHAALTITPVVRAALERAARETDTSDAQSNLEHICREFRP